jgi:type IX secretion system PorP/SprF family membrane protein
MKKLLILCFSLSLGKAYAQDPHYSQFFANPLTLNPALTGTGEGEGRLSANLRNTWIGGTSPFSTGLLGFDKAILGNKLQSTDKLGLGGFAMYDQSNGGALKSTALALSFAYLKGLDEVGTSSLSVGFQASYANKRLDYSKLTFEDQFGSGGFNEEVPSGDAGLSNSRSYADFNVGLAYHYQKDKMKATVGATLNHLFAPTDYMWDNLSRKRRVTIHTGGQYDLSQEASIEWNAIYQTKGKATELAFGGAYGFRMNAQDPEAIQLWLGGYYRIDDALYPYLAVDYKNVRAGLSYDLTVSSMKAAASSRRSIEFSVLVRFAKKKVEEKPATK